ncbi:hypothetical protein D3C80_2008680 [compost metagenome]
MASIMSSAPLSLVDPDNIHIAIMISKIPKGTVAKGGTLRNCIIKAANVSATMKTAPLGKRS